MSRAQKMCRCMATLIRFVVYQLFVLPCFAMSWLWWCWVVCIHWNPWMNNITWWKMAQHEFPWSTSSVTWTVANFDNKDVWQPQRQIFTFQILPIGQNEVSQRVVSLRSGFPGLVPAASTVHFPTCCSLSLSPSGGYHMLPPTIEHINSDARPWFHTVYLGLRAVGKQAAVSYYEIFNEKAGASSQETLHFPMNCDDGLGQTNDRTNDGSWVTRNSKPAAMFSMQ